MGTKATWQSGGKGHAAKGRGKVPLADHVEGKMAPASKAGRKPKVGTTAPAAIKHSRPTIVRLNNVAPIPISEPSPTDCP